MTKPLIRLLLPHAKHTTNHILSDPSTPKSLSQPLLEEGQQDSYADLGGPTVPRPGSLRALLTTPTHTVHYYWRKFDDAFMRPVFGGRGFAPFVPGSPTERSVRGGQWEKENCTIIVSKRAVHWKQASAWLKTFFITFCWGFSVEVSCLHECSVNIFCKSSLLLCIL